MIGRTWGGEGQEEAVLGLDTPPDLGLYPAWVGTGTLSQLEKERGLALAGSLPAVFAVTQAQVGLWR